MQITRISKITGISHTLEINVTEEQIKDWKSGTFIQVAMPHLTPDEREFIMTGITAEEWDKYCGNIEEKEEEDEDIPLENNYNDEDYPIS